MSKYVVVTGGSISNVGKGVTAGSLGRLFKNRGINVTIQKFDPYLNVDPGTMSPYQHGEVYVTEDGGECSLDIGHYERFLGTNLSKANNISAGRLYSSVINKERTGKYVGATVQTIPNVSNEAKDAMLSMAKSGAEIVIIEIGGTVNDYETGVFLTAVRQLKLEVGDENFFLVHVDIVPQIDVLKEPKIESFGLALKTLNNFGLNADALVCRTSKSLVLSKETKTRIARRYFLGSADAVIQNKDTETVYEIPLELEKEGLAKLILDKFKLEAPKTDLKSWTQMVEKYNNSSFPEVKVCIVGKYTKVSDAYISIEEAIKHASTYNQVKPKIELIDAEDLEEAGVDRFLKGAKAIIVPPGWGSRGFDGMMLAVQYARENKIPYLGIGLGMQIAVIEFARNVLKLYGANTTEIDPNTQYPVIDIMAEQKSLVMKGGTMRLGVYNCVLDPSSISAKLYGKELITERHRHRYEFNSKFYDKFEKEGMIFAGMNPQSKLIELIELKKHPFFVAAIFEPDKHSRPNHPHPLFMGLMNTAKSVR